jgi:hypothetical protein
VPDVLVTVVGTKWYGTDALELTYKLADGSVRAEILCRDTEAEELSADEVEELQKQTMDVATAARSIDELRAAIAMVETLRERAATVHASGLDTKWVGLPMVVRVASS